ncbi:MAG: hypothetical protein ABSE41_07285 [Bacteroidota bacterium]|jgi:hypothetical protein
MTLDVSILIGAMKPILDKYWGDVKDYAESEAAKMAKTLETVVQLRVAGKIDDQQAQALVEMQKNAMQAVLLAIQGIGLIAAQKAINAALAAVKDIVNKAIGFPLL